MTEYEVATIGEKSRMFSHFGVLKQLRFEV